MADPLRGIFVCCIIVLAACASGCNSSGGQSSTLTASAPVVQDEKPIGYRIDRDDALEISVFMVPSLNRVVQVDSHGKIDLPLLGSIVAGGRTTRELEADIAQRLGAKYVRSPQVSVSLKEGLAQRYAVDGAVLKPGIYLAKGETSLLQAVAQAGGTNDVGDIDDVTIIRNVEGRREATRYSLRAIRKGEASDPQVYGKDAVIVGESTPLTTLKFVKDFGGPVLGIARYAIP